MCTNYLYLDVRRLSYIPSPSNEQLSTAGILRVIGCSLEQFTCGCKRRRLCRLYLLSLTGWSKLPLHWHLRPTRSTINGTILTCLLLEYIRRYILNIHCAVNSSDLITSLKLYLFLNSRVIIVRNREKDWMNYTLRCTLGIFTRIPVNYQWIWTVSENYRYFVKQEAWLKYHQWSSVDNAIVLLAVSLRRYWAAVPQEGTT